MIANGKLTIRSILHEAPSPRKGRLKDEAGVSPALSRNCKICHAQIESGRSPHAPSSTDLADRRWDWLMLATPKHPLSCGKGIFI